MGLNKPSPGCALRWRQIDPRQIAEKASHVQLHDLIFDGNVALDDSFFIGPHSYRSRAKFFGQCRIDKGQLKRNYEHGQNLIVECADVDPRNGGHLQHRERLNGLQQRHAFKTLASLGFLTNPVEALCAY